MDYFKLQVKLVIGGSGLFSTKLGSGASVPKILRPSLRLKFTNWSGLTH